MAKLLELGSFGIADSTGKQTLLKGLFWQFGPVLDQRKEIFGVRSLQISRRSRLNQILAHVVLIEHRHSFGPNMKLAREK